MSLMAMVMVSFDDGDVVVLIVVMPVLMLIQFLVLRSWCALTLLLIVMTVMMVMYDGGDAVAAIVECVCIDLLWWCCI